MPKNIGYLIVFCLLIVGAAACSMISKPTSSMEDDNLPTAIVVQTEAPLETEQPLVVEPAIKPSQPPASLPVVEGIYTPAFANYPDVEVSIPQQNDSVYTLTLPLDVSKVVGFDLVDFTPQQEALLAKNGFVILSPQPGKYHEFFQVYEEQRAAFEQPVFATTDAALHVYHLIFDKLLRDLEQKHLIAHLKTLTSGMLSASQSQVQSLKGTNLEEAAVRNEAYFSVAAQLLGLPDPVPPEVKDLVAAEISLIQAQEGEKISPLWDRADLNPESKFTEDYSQYIPKGHYTSNDTLQSYFRTMTWYGHMVFRSGDIFEMQRALLIAQSLRTAKSSDGTPLIDTWQRIYDPVAFLLGEANTLSILEYGLVADQVFGTGQDAQVFANKEQVKRFVDTLGNQPAEKHPSLLTGIVADSGQVKNSLRFMPGRFTLDEAVFRQMVWRNVGSEAKPRGLPKVLDFFASQGSGEALNLLNQMGETQYDQYQGQMDLLRNQIGALGKDAWTRDAYGATLFALQPLIQQKDARYPIFMQAQAWAQKDLQTALASWTELKHEAAMNAGQVMADMGGASPGEPPHGYVEPNPEVYARLVALTEMTQQGMDARGLITETMRGNLEFLKGVLTFMKDTSIKELSGQELSEDDYWRIQNFGGEIEGLTLAAADCEASDTNSCLQIREQRTDLVLDAAVGINADGSPAVLTAGVGQPTEIYVVLPDQPWRLAVGAVFSYYEFTLSPDQGMTDEQWYNLLEQGKNPPQPAWTSNFIAP